MPDIANNADTYLDVHPLTGAGSIFYKPEGDILPGMTHQVAAIDKKDLFMQYSLYNHLIRTGFCFKINDISKDFKDLDSLGRQIKSRAQCLLLESIYDNAYHTKPLFFHIRMHDLKLKFIMKLKNQSNLKIRIHD